MADGLARQIAGLTGDIRNLGKRIPSYQRGVVANVSPPTVVMDRDVTATPRPVADVLVPGLAVGQRVEVRVIGSRRVITSIRPAPWTPVTSIESGFSIAAPIFYRVRDGLIEFRGAISPDDVKTVGPIYNLFQIPWAPPTTFRESLSAGADEFERVVFLDLTMDGTVRYQPSQNGSGGFPLKALNGTYVAPL